MIAVPHASLYAGNVAEWAVCPLENRMENKIFSNTLPRLNSYIYEIVEALTSLMSHSKKRGSFYLKLAFIEKFVSLRNVIFRETHKK